MQKIRPAPRRRGKDTAASGIVDQLADLDHRIERSDDQEEIDRLCDDRAALVARLAALPTRDAQVALAKLRIVEEFFGPPAGDGLERRLLRQVLAWLSRVSPMMITLWICQTYAAAEPLL